MQKNTMIFIAVLAVAVIGGVMLISQGNNNSANNAQGEPAMEQNQGQAELDSMDQGMASEQNIVEVAQSAGSFTTLVAAVEAAGLAETLSGPGPFTVFAPTDEAFAKLPAGTVESLLLPENREQLVSILTYHVVPGKVMAADVVNLQTATTVQGSHITIDASSGAVMVDNATVTQTDIEASNGVIHVIDTVIIPE